MPQTHHPSNSSEETEEEQTIPFPPLVEEEEAPEQPPQTVGGIPIIPFLLSLIAFIPLAVVVAWFLSAGDSPAHAALKTEARSNTSMGRTPVYFLSHGGVSSPY